MAKFEEEKVINALHPEKAEIGKKYWVSDSIGNLKKHIETDELAFVHELLDIRNGADYRFAVAGENCWDLIYPYEEPKEQNKTILEDNDTLNKWVDELKAQIEEMKNCRNEEYCKGYEAGYNAGKEDLQMLQEKIEELKRNGR